MVFNTSGLSTPRVCKRRVRLTAVQYHHNGQAGLMFQGVSWEKQPNCTQPAFQNENTQTHTCSHTHTYTPAHTHRLTCARTHMLRGPPSQTRGGYDLRVGAGALCGARHTCLDTTYPPLTATPQLSPAKTPLPQRRNLQILARRVSTTLKDDS